VGAPLPIDDSLAGRAFQTDSAIERPQSDGVRVFIPLLDGTDRVGVLAFTLDTVDAPDRRLCRRLAGLVADMLVTKSMYTDRFFQARRRQPLSLAAEMQWQLLPPLMMNTPQVAVAGALEPAYDVAGDSFDYALNDDILHVAMIDAMGHGLGAALTVHGPDNRQKSAPGQSMMVPLAIPCCSGELTPRRRRRTSAREQKGTNPSPPDRTRRTRRTAIVLRTPPPVLNDTAANCGPPFGTKRPQAQILSPRPCFRRSEPLPGLVRACIAACAATKYRQYRNRSEL